MVFIQLDSGAFKEFTAPCEITIGRGDSNDLQPESQSVSKAHATIHLAVDPLKNSVDATLEDLNSRNGSFIGSSPLELSRVPKGAKASISFGDYIRFGHSQKLFRYLERIPPSPLSIIEQPTLEEEDELQVLPTEKVIAGIENGAKESGSGGVKRDEYDFELVNSDMMSKHLGVGSQSSIYPARDWASDSNRNLAIGFTAFNFNDDDSSSIPKVRVEAVKMPLYEPSQQEVSIVNELRGGDLTGRDAQLRKSKEVDLSVPLLSECLAESLNEHFALTSAGMINKIMMDMNDLITQCMRGTKLPMPASSDKDNSSEIDKLLSEAMVGVIESTLSRVHALASTGLVMAMSAADAGENSKLAHLSIHNSIADLKALHQFATRDITTKRLWKDLQPSVFYEVIVCMLLGVLEQLEKSSEVIWGIKAKSDSATKEHVLQRTNPESAVVRSGKVQKPPQSSLSLELEELRRYKREAEIRQQSEKEKILQDSAKDIKLLRIRRLLAVWSAYLLREAWRKWKSRRKRDNLLRMVMNRRSLQWKKIAWSRWSAAATAVKLKQNQLKRVLRIIAGNLAQRLRALFFQWWRAVRVVKAESFEEKVEDSPPEYPVRGSSVKMDKDAEIARLKYEVINLKAALHEVSKEKELPGLLAAERALVRELSAENVQLRAFSQALDNKLLELADCPQRKRRDLVYRHLVTKEDELMAAKQHIDTLTAELDRIQQLNLQNVSEAPATADLNLPEIAVRGRSTEKRRVKKPPSQQEALEGNHQQMATAGADRMSQDTARIVILSEVRRLRDSHRAAEEALQLLQENVSLEATKSAQVSLALSATQNRLRSLERSSAALRELLRQRVGDHGVLNLIEALENMGAGPAALLEAATVSGGSHDGASNRDHAPIGMSSYQRYGDNGYFDDPPIQRSRNKTDLIEVNKSNSKRSGSNNNNTVNFPAQRFQTDFSFAVDNALYN